MPPRARILSVGLMLGLVSPAVLRSEADLQRTLVEALVGEGVLTEQQANNVLARVAAQLSSAAEPPLSPVASVQPGKGVRQLRLFGDLRLRRQASETTYWDSGDLADESTRYRVRLRAGGELEFSQGWSAAIRFDTSPGHTGRNADFGNNARRNDLGIFLGVAQIAYELPGGFGPFEALRFVAGKQHLPFYSNGVGGFSLSRELTVEGLTSSADLNLPGGQWSLAARAGQYVQRTREQSSPSGEHTEIDFLVMGQVELARHWNGGAKLLLAPLFLGFLPSDYAGDGTADAVADTTRPLTSNYEDLASVSLPAQLSWPVGEGNRLTLFGTFSHNLEGRSRARRFLRPDVAVSSAMANFYNLGVTWIRAGTELTAEYRNVGAGALTTALSQPAFNGGRNNARGFVFEITQALTASVETSLTYLSAEAIHPEAGGFTAEGGTSSDGLGYRDYQVLLLDLMVKF